MSVTTWEQQCKQDTDNETMRNNGDRNNNVAAQEKTAPPDEVQLMCSAMYIMFHDRHNIGHQRHLSSTANSRKQVDSYRS